MLLVLGAVNALAAGGRLTVSLGLTAQPRGDGDWLRCDATRDVSTNETWDWTVALVLQEDRVEVDCSASETSEGLVIRTAATLRTRPRPRDSHLALQFTTKTQDGEVVRERSLYFDFDSQVTVPVHLPAAGDPGVHDVFVRVDVRPADQLAVQYSSLAIRSRSVGARILLDGGLAGSVQDGGLTTLKPVQVGERLVALEDDGRRGMVRRGVRGVPTRA
jgi:hypothetical protein